MGVWLSSDELFIILRLDFLNATLWVGSQEEVLLLKIVFADIGEYLTAYAANATTVSSMVSLLGLIKYFIYFLLGFYVITLRRKLWLQLLQSRKRYFWRWVLVSLSYKAL